jgi:hypothetical protein
VGSTFDLLESFDKAHRVLVTPLKPSRAPELELRYSRGSYYRPYREHDELRIAACWGSWWRWCSCTATLVWPIEAATTCGAAPAARARANLTIYDHT